MRKRLADADNIAKPADPDAAKAIIPDKTPQGPQVISRGNAALIGRLMEDVADETIDPKAVIALYRAERREAAAEIARLNLIIGDMDDEVKHFRAITGLRLP